MSELMSSHSVSSPQAPTDTLSQRWVHEGILKWAASDPHRTALVQGHQRLTYGELERTSNQVAQALVQAGFAAGAVIGVIGQSDCSHVISWLGALRAGCICIPIAADESEAQLQQMVATAAVELFIGDIQSTQSHLCVPTLSVGTHGCGALNVTAEQATARTIVADVACVLFRADHSNTLYGTPLTHQALVETVHAVNAAFNVSASDMTLSLCPLSSDLAWYDLLGLLNVGGGVVLASKHSPSELPDLLQREPVTMFNAVPGLLQDIAEYVSARSAVLDRLRLVLISKDRITRGLFNDLKRIAPQARLVALGGATEAGIWSTVQDLDQLKQDWRKVPYGQPLAGRSVYVLNERLQPVPTWVPGNIFLSGDGLSPGYWHDEQRTRDQFVHSERLGCTLLRTGEVGRRLPDNTIEPIGRSDQQVKIDGYRVDLSEIEAALSENANVKQAVARPSAHENSMKLVAFVNCRIGEFEPDRWLKQLQAQLPEYMVPERILRVDKMPLAQDGRIDVQALAQLAQQASVEVQVAASPPVNDRVVAQLLAIASKVLDLEVRDPSANLLDLGATSIDVIRVINQIESEMGLRLAVEEFFRWPSLSEASRMIQTMSGDVPLTPVVSADGSSSSVLTDPVERDRFKKARFGLREVGGASASVMLALDEASFPSHLQHSYRRSHRQFAAHRVGFDDFSHLLACLREVTLRSEPKYLYPSAGGLYPVQTYVYVKPERIERLAAGAYYYHPTQHRLVSLQSTTAISRDAFDWINQPLFDQAAMGLFFVMQRRAIAPMYGNLARDFALYEAGAMGQLLMTAAPAFKIGMCGIGSAAPEQIRECFALDDGHELLHSMLAGAIPDGEVAGDKAAQESRRVYEMLERLERLSKEEVRAMLESREIAGGKKNDL